MKGNFETRIAKLEQYRKPARQWLYHVSEPPTAEEQAAIATAQGAVIIAPWPCKTVNEWMLRYSQTETMQ